MSDDSKKKVEEPKPKEPKAPETEDLSKATEIVVTSKGKRAHVRRWRFTKEPTRLVVASLSEDDKAALIGPRPDPSVIVRKG